MSNRLAKTNSPYLLQHKDNPVDWYPWGDEALDKAKEEKKPIFLSIGYAACHWCHVMEYESFEDPETAAIMNKNFINIKVDREERPDLDAIYMNAVVAMTGQGGWPMSVFLTPNGEPFYGGTYFPPTRRFNMPSFREVLLGVANAWENDKAQVLDNGKKVRQRIEREYKPIAAIKGQIENSSMEKALMGLAQSYDWENGGWGQAPKFPQPMAVEFLLRHGARDDKFALEIATHALRAMAKGGMYDVVGGGFARYSVDNDWLVPHFEKMLYDNAQLATVYLYAYKLTGDDSFREVCEETLDYVVREMTHSDGGFFSSLDADSEGEEGKYYVWTPSEIEEALGEMEADFIISAYGVTEEGNFEGKNILQRVKSNRVLAKEFQLDADEVPERLSRAHKRLYEVRERRVRPGLDDKVLVSWNGMMMLAFSEAGRYLGFNGYVDMAIRNANFLLNHLRSGNRLFRSWRDGSAQHNAYLEDYASIVLGLISLYQTDPDTRWFNAAQNLVSEMIEQFSDPNGGFYDTRDDHETLIVRPKDLQDNATPSGNALATYALLQVATLTGESELLEKAEENVVLMQSLMSRHPLAFSKWLCAADFLIGPVQEIALLGAAENQTRNKMYNTIWSAFRPRTVVAVSDFPPLENAPPLLLNRSLINNQPTAYVCEQFVCQEPVNTPEDLIRQLELRGND